MDFLQVPATLESLGRVTSYVLKAAKVAGLSPKATQCMRLAVDEIAINIVTHGYDDAGTHGHLDLTSQINDQGLTIVLEDTGKSYDPSKFERPLSLDNPLDERPVGGLGVYLAMHNVDRFRYERVADRNRHTFFVGRISSMDD